MRLHVDCMNNLKKPNDSVAGQLLARLAEELEKPLRALIAEIHTLDERNAEDAEDADSDRAAHLVEFGYDLQSILEAVTAFAKLETVATANNDDKTTIDVSSLLEETIAAPELAASFNVAVRGELGTSFGDKAEIEHALSLCLRLMGRMTKDKTRLQVHREVHELADRIVFSMQIREPKPLALELLKRTVHLLGASVDIDARSLLFGFPVRPKVDKTESSSAKPLRPVLAFRQDERTRPTEDDVTERGAIVLVVDDEPAAREYLSRILELEGFDVVRSSTLEDAYEAAHAYKPHVITLDRLQLAREEVDWVRRFKEDPALARIPLVLVQSEESESLGLVGVLDVVRKPINPDEVLATIDRLTGASSSPLLLVRDEEDASKWERCLEGDPRRVVTASTVSEAERILDTVTPTAVIVDFRIMNGTDTSRTFSLLEHIRRSDRTRDVPVVAIHGRLTKKARLHLESLVDRRLTFSELSRRSLQATLLELTGDGEQSGFGAG